MHLVSRSMDSRSEHYLHCPRHRTEPRGARRDNEALVSERPEWLAALSPCRAKGSANALVARSVLFTTVGDQAAETKVEPNAVRDDLGRKPMASVQAIRHSSSLPLGEGQRD